MSKVSIEAETQVDTDIAQSTTEPFLCNHMLLLQGRCPLLPAMARLVKLTFLKRFGPGFSRTYSRRPTT